MSTSAGLYRASEAEIAKLLGDPGSVEEFFERAAWAPPVREVRPKGLLGWLMKMSPVKVFENDPDANPPPGYDGSDDRPHCDLEGVWHGLHFLFTGTAWGGEEPACYLIRGGAEIGDVDELGSGVLHALSPAKVQQVYSFLRALSREELERRFNPARMMELEIDPEHWNRTPANGHRPLDHLLEGYSDLRAFMEQTSKSNDGAVVYVS